jgi:S1-C subfamily serine protease
VHTAKHKVSDATLAQQTAKQAALDAAVARHAAKFVAVDTAAAQQAARQTALETTVAVHTAKHRVSDASLAQQTAKQAALDAAVARHAARLGAAEAAVRQLTALYAELVVQGPASIARGLFDNVKGACSQICFRLGGASYIGSGWFYYETPDDLRHGYFVTAAHCVMQVDDGALQTMESAFIQEPTTCSWTAVDASNVFYDGAADIALIKTNIDLTGSPHCALRLATTDASAGDTCYVVGNPGGLDEDSISVGCVRDPHYTEPSGSQITDSLFVTCPGMGGNSGGPIVNVSGGVIGIFTFGMGTAFGGGSNVGTLRKSLLALKTMRNNRRKRYLGLDWHVPSPFTLAGYYEPNVRFRPCVRIREVSADSPFDGILGTGDLLLSALLPNGDVVEFGNTNEQRTPGVLLYYDAMSIQVSYIKPSRGRMTATVTLDRTYEDVSVLCDAPLQSGMLRLLRGPSPLLTMQYREQSEQSAVAPVVEPVEPAEPGLGP